MKKRECLALNATYEPLRMVDVPKALRLVLDGKAEVVEVSDRIVHSEKLAMPRPVVIRLKQHVHVPFRFRKNVTNTFLFARDKYTCAYCGRTDKELGKRERLNRDHVIPQCQGGLDVWTNVVTSCDTCNSKKADRTPKQASMKLRITPTEPHFVHLKWAVRTLTEMQLRYIALFYGEETVAQLRRLMR